MPYRGNCADGLAVRMPDTNRDDVGSSPAQRIGCGEKEQTRIRPADAVRMCLNLKRGTVDLMVMLAV